MKRILICAAAAIVALASCSKTQVVYNDAPEEISFRAINKPMTKTTVDYTEDLGVSAYVIDGDPYFENKPFTFDGSKWTGGQYWPIEDALGFVAYGPGVDCATTVETSTTGISATGVKSDVDFVYSKAFADNGGTGYTRGNAPVNGIPVELAHAKSKIVINVNVVGTNEEVTAITLKDAGATGDCAVTFGNDPVWDPAKIVYDDFEFFSQNTHYVIPGTPTDLIITYNTTSPAATGVTHSIDLSGVVMKDTGDNVVASWLSGYGYTYNVTINSKEIVITADVDSWTETTGALLSRKIFL